MRTSALPARSCIMSCITWLWRKLLSSQTKCNSEGVSKPGHKCFQYFVLRVPRCAASTCSGRVFCLNVSLWTKRRCVYVGFLSTWLSLDKFCLTLSTRGKGRRTRRSIYRLTDWSNSHFICDSEENRNDPAVSAAAALTIIPLEKKKKKKKNAQGGKVVCCNIVMKKYSITLKVSYTNTDRSYLLLSTSLHFSWIYCTFQSTALSLQPVTFAD